MHDVCGLVDEVRVVRTNLHEMVINLVPHAFAALTLGFAAGSSFGGADKKNWANQALHAVEHRRGIVGGGVGGGSGLYFGEGSGGRTIEAVFASWHQIGSVLWHEGIPMLLYDQVLTWGNSVVALAVNFLWRFGADPFSGAWGAESGLSPFAGAVITLGLEAGRDVLPSQLRGDSHAEATVHLADNAGLLLSLILGCLLLTALLSRVDSDVSLLSEESPSPSSSSSATAASSSSPLFSSAPDVDADAPSSPSPPSSSEEEEAPGMVSEVAAMLGRTVNQQAQQAWLRRVLFGPRGAFFSSAPGIARCHTRSPPLFRQSHHKGEGMDGGRDGLHGGLTLSHSVKNVAHRAEHFQRLPRRVSDNGAGVSGGGSGGDVIMTSAKPSSSSPSPSPVKISVSSSSSALPNDAVVDNNNGNVEGLAGSSCVGGSCEGAAVTTGKQIRSDSADALGGSSVSDFSGLGAHVALVAVSVVVS
jgi:hypothetical protein